jgi:hypothetical protein
MVPGRFCERLNVLKLANRICQKLLSATKQDSGATYVDMTGVVSNSTRLRSSEMGPLPFLAPSVKGFSEMTGMLLRAVRWEGIINVEANVALRAGSSKLPRLVRTLTESTMV